MHQIVKHATTALSYDAPEAYLSMVILSWRMTVWVQEVEVVLETALCCCCSGTHTPTSMWKSPSASTSTGGSPQMSPAFLRYAQNLSSSASVQFAHDDVEPANGASARLEGLLE